MPLKRELDRLLIFARRHGVKATVAELATRATRKVQAGDNPAAVHIEVSNCCNLHCEYCVLDEATHGKKIMSEETFETLVPVLAHARRIDLSGLAEPLMNTHFIALLAKARAAAPQAHIAMCTNATLLTEAVSEQLVASGLDELVFSLDGIDPAQVDAVRHGGSLDTVLQNIRTLQQVKKRLGADKPVLSATVVLQKENLGQLPGIVRLAAELGCEGVSVNGLEPYSAPLVGHAIWADPAAVPELASALREAQEFARSLGIELRLPAMSPQAPLCPQASRPMVLADGTVVPCSVLAYERLSLLAVDDEGEIVHRQGVTAPLEFGNIAVGGLAAVWNSDEYHEFRRRVRNGDFPDPCRSCLMKHNVICATPPLTAEESIATIPHG